MVRFWQFSAMMVPASNKYSYNAQAIDFFVDVRSRTNGANGKKSRVAGKEASQPPYPSLVHGYQFPSA